jgi:hypothetical protein
MGWAQTDAANPKLSARARTSRNDTFLAFLTFFMRLDLLFLNIIKKFAFHGQVFLNLGKPPSFVLPIPSRRLAWAKRCQARSFTANAA